MQRLSTVQYMALGHYRSGGRYRYLGAAVDDLPHRRELWGVRVVSLSGMSEYDWKRGARGEGDFWDLVEREVSGLK
jgi:hypothetical protein